jgi:hypothetical protein
VAVGVAVIVGVGVVLGVRVIEGVKMIGVKLTTVRMGVMVPVTVTVGVGVMLPGLGANDRKTNPAQ